MGKQQDATFPIRYKAKTKKQIKHIADAFKEFLDDYPFIDVVQLKKVGYAFLAVNDAERECTLEPIYRPEDLLNVIFTCIRFSMESKYNVDQLDAEMTAEYKNVVMQYIDKLTEEKDMAIAAYEQYASCMYATFVDKYQIY